MTELRKDGIAELWNNGMPEQEAEYARMMMWYIRTSKCFSGQDLTEWNMPGTNCACKEIETPCLDDAIAHLMSQATQGVEVRIEDTEDGYPHPFDWSNFKPTNMDELAAKLEVESGHPFNCRVFLPPDMEEEFTKLSESEREARLKELVAGHRVSIPVSGVADTQRGEVEFSLNMVFTIRPLHIDKKRGYYFFPFDIVHEFITGAPDSLDWTEEDPEWTANVDACLREREDAWEDIWQAASKAIDDLEFDLPKPVDFSLRTIPMAETEAPGHFLQSGYFKAPGRLLNTPRYAAKQENFDFITQWYQLSEFNRTVGMAAAALTKYKTREEVTGWQKATVKQIEDLIYCLSEEGKPSHGQHFFDITKAFGALRKIEVPFQRVVYYKKPRGDNRWDREVTWVSASWLQAYAVVFMNRETKEEVYTSDSLQKGKMVKAKQNRRKKTQALIDVQSGPDMELTFPPDKYKLIRFEWRWNTDIAEDFICPTHAIDAKGMERKKPFGRSSYCEGINFVNTSKNYFKVIKHIRDANGIYAQRLLDMIISSVHGLSAYKDTVWLDREVEKVIQWLGLWDEYNRGRKKHVIEDHIKPAIESLIREKVLLPGSWTEPREDSNQNRRRGEYFHWRVSKQWSTSALVKPRKVIAIEAEYDDALPQADAMPVPDQAVLPGIEDGPPIPSGADIKAARESAGLTMRDFARFIGGPCHASWGNYEIGKTNKLRTTPEVWEKVREFVAEHLPKEGS